MPAHANAKWTNFSFLADIKKLTFYNLNWHTYLWTEWVVFISCLLLIVVAEIFFLGKEDKYLEVELCP